MRRLQAGGSAENCLIKHGLMSDTIRYRLAFIHCGIHSVDSVKRFPDDSLLNKLQ